jgi:two-component system cell cycle response regulator CtrA
MAHDPLDALRRQVADARAENQRLRDELAPPGYVPAVFGLTPTDERAFKALLSRDQWTKEALLASIYLEHAEQDIPDIKIIDVSICKLRAKLKPFGLDIETFWGRGYRMTPATRARATILIDRALNDEAAAAWPAADAAPSAGDFLSV